MIGDTNVNESNVTFLLARETKLNTSEINPALEKLVLFTNLNAEQKEEEIINPESGIVKENEHYVLYHDGGTYAFTLLEDKEYVQQIDRDILADKEERKRYFLSRTLRLASSCHFADARWILATSPIDFINCLIETENTIIDYARNLIMNKEEYYVLFAIKEISRIDRYDLCTIYQIILERPNSNLLYYFLLAPKEMLREVYKNFPTVLDFVSEYGIHERNCLLWNDIDFFNEELDKKYLKYKDVINVLEEFTLNPNGQKENFKKVNELLYEAKFTDIEFSLILLSDFYVSQKDTLVSENRFHKCFFASPKLAYTLSQDPEYSNFKISVVSGKFKRDDKNYYYHTWVEVDFGPKVIVFDYTKNTVMNRDNYYELYGIQVLESIEIDEYIKITKRLYEDFGMHLKENYINYFGRELYQETERILGMFKN